LILPVLLAGAVASSGCLYMQSKVDFEKQTDWTVYRTYSVERARPIDDDRGLARDEGFEADVDQRAQARLRERLTDKNLREAPAGEADLNVRYYLTVREDIRSEDRPGHVRWLRVDIREIHYESYTKGTVVVDVADRQQNLLVWHGAAEASVKTPEKQGDRLGSNLEKALDILMNQFPPRQPGDWSFGSPKFPVTAAE
jgi:hypothetical protein